MVMMILAVMFVVVMVCVSTYGGGYGGRWYGPYIWGSDGRMMITND